MSERAYFTSKEVADRLWKFEHPDDKYGITLKEVGAERDKARKQQQHQQQQNKPTPKTDSTKKGPCTHCGHPNHNADGCWKLHPEKNPFLGRGGAEKKN